MTFRALQPRAALALGSTFCPKEGRYSLGRHYLGQAQRPVPGQRAELPGQRQAGAIGPALVSLEPCRIITLLGRRVEIIERGWIFHWLVSLRTRPAGPTVMI